MVQLNYIHIANYTTESGKTTNIKLSYQAFGKSLNDAPIVLVNHALTGNSEVIGENGWWNDLIGDHKCIDTKNYCILAFNVPGNGFDNTKESLIDNYKDFTARDIAKIFTAALKQLNIYQLFAVIGGSLGGGIAWEMAACKPNFIKHLIPISADWKSTDWLIANCHIQDAILNNSSQPLVDARMHAMTLYRTPESFTHKFNRSKRSNNLFNTVSWLNYHGEKLNLRFNIKAYKLMNQLLKTIDITQNRGSFLEIASKITSHIHMVTINSDLFFKPEENWKTYEELKKIKGNVNIYEINSIHGHDGFLIEFEQLSNFLKPIFQSKKLKNVS
ncbi:MAG: homoserine acetyltransferase [Lutibacter sp.]|nr:MAG: homoserine acetyltransferase [Lutibacter sp.]